MSQRATGKLAAHSSLNLERRFTTKTLFCKYTVTVQESKQNSFIDIYIKIAMDNLILNPNHTMYQSRQVGQGKISESVQKLPRSVFKMDHMLTISKI